MLLSSLTSASESFTLCNLSSLMMQVHKVEGSECDMPFRTVLTCICFPKDTNMP